MWMQTYSKFAVNVASVQKLGAFPTLDLTLARSTLRDLVSGGVLRCARHVELKPCAQIIVVIAVKRATSTTTRWYST